MVQVKIAFIILIVFQSVLSFAQNSGCKDPLANNYNPAATVNDGSCTYSITDYAPPVKVSALNNILQETSGLEWDGKSLWSFNDGGGAAAIYRIDTTSNAILQTVTLQGATNIDWEDIAFDGVYFYIGDFGNNVNGARNNLKIYKFPASAIPDYIGNSAITVPSASIEIINFLYSDQPLPLTPTAANATKFDCEAMIVDEGKIHLFTKNWINNNSTHYVIDNITAGNYTAVPVETLETGYLVTAADKSPGSKVIALLGYEPVFPGNHYMHLLSDYSSNKYFNGNKRKISLQNSLFMGQSEGITFRTDTYGYISNERISNSLGTINPMLHSFNINAFVPSYVLPVRLANVKAYEEGAKVKVRWTAKTESNIVNYEIEKLVGQTYTTVGSVKPTNSSSASKEYTWTDTDIKGGFNFYRIKVIDKSGSIFYSEVVSVTINKTKQVSIFPNPVRNGVIKFNYSKIDRGTYNVSVYNKQGSKMYSSNITLDDISSTRTIELPKSLPAGLYSFVMSDLKGLICNKEFIIESARL